ncbi:hypothetical protein Aduo_015684 [Ancylostoma duodenale]
MIDFTMFECEIEPTCGKEAVSPVPAKLPPSPVREQRLQSIRKHLEQVYEADRVLLWKMSHCTAYTQMTEILAGLSCLSPVIRAKRSALDLNAKCLFLCMPVNS